MIVVKTIFVYDESFININIKTIENFIKTFKKIIFIGYIYKEIPKILDLIKNYDNEIYYVNYGKMFWIKQSQKYIKNYNYVLYSDHDILFENFNENIFDIINKYKYIVFSQENDDRIVIDKIGIKMVKEDNIKYGNIKYNHLVASGCFICMKYIYQLLNIDTVKNNIIYGNEDFLIGKKLKDNNINIYIIDYKVIHLDCPNEKYKKSKIDMISNIYNKSN